MATEPPLALALAEFTLSQRKIARALLRGYSNKEISEQLGISIPYIKHQLSAMYAQSGALDRLQFVLLLLAPLITDALDEEARHGSLPT